MELSIQEGAQLLEQRMEFVCGMIAECSTLPAECRTTAVEVLTASLVGYRELLAVLVGDSKAFEALSRMYSSTVGYNVDKSSNGMGLL